MGQIPVDSGAETWRIVFLDRDTIGPGVTLPAPEIKHQWIDYPSTDPGEVAQRLEGAAVAITNKVPITARILDQLSDLRLVALAATGANVVDIEACRERGVAVCNVRNYATTAVPELVLAAVFSLRRQLPLFRQRVLDGDWQAANQFCFFNPQPARDVACATLGIIGTGGIARGLGQRARCLGMQVVHHSVSGRILDDLELTDLASLLAGSDVVSLHCPLNEQTANLIDAAALGRMRRGALLVNTARGGIVDLPAVADALDSGHLGGAALDVFDTEPPPADGLAMDLAQRSNVIVTPHIAWASVDAMQALADQLVANIEAFAAGERVNRLD